MTPTYFSDLDLSPPLLKSLSEEGYSSPTPIQAAAIPAVLAGQDLIATAQTGTGKTAAFSLPILELLAQGPRTRNIRALVLSPTRELALQIADSFRRYGRHLPLRTVVLIGGVPMGHQLRDLRARPDIVIATPGRLSDIIKRMQLPLNDVRHLVLDEADRMLDMGFLPDVRRIVGALPHDKQSLLFSATMSREIEQLAGSLLKSPAKIEIARPATVNEAIEQRVMFVDQGDKLKLLTEFLKNREMKGVLVFTRTKHRADKVARHLRNTQISAEAIHSDRPQNARQRALGAFDAGRVSVLVATDIVARGIDVENISHVVNFELPNDSESYVHRIGRTARGGARGAAVSFCAMDELDFLAGIEKLTKLFLQAEESHSFHSATIVKARRTPSAAPNGRRPFNNRQRNGRRWGRPQNGHQGGFSRGRREHHSRA